MGMTENKLLQGALDAAAAGLYVFPLKAGGKSPLFGGWQQASTRDPGQIAKWWEQNPAANVGVDCQKSGVFALDFDAADNKPGLQKYNEWIGSTGAPDTWTVRSARGGLHLYFRGHTSNRVDLYPGVDVRGDGGLAVLPPSTFDGKPYKWEKPPIVFPLAECDADVSAFLAGPEPEQQRKPYTVPEVLEEGRRTSGLVALAGSLIAKGVSAAAAEAAIREENESICCPPLTDDELQREVFPCLYRDKWQQSQRPYTHDLPVNAAMVDKLRRLDPANSRRYPWTDSGAARLFVDACGDRCKFAADRKKWLYYDGRRWDADGENAVKEQLRALADALTVYGLRDVADDRRADFLKWAASWQKLRQRETIMRDAASVAPVTSDAFDRDPFVLNVQNGTLDLKTFSLKPHSAGDLLSRVAAVAYDPAAAAPRWLQFIDEITGGDRALARYLQKCAGYSLTGDTRHECMFIAFGPTSRNGKSTLLETVGAMLGDYSATANPETFTKASRTGDNSPREDIARLAGVRFVVASELPRGCELNAALVKQLTGRDSIKARRLYESSFEFTPQFKLFFNSNHRPRVDDLTVFQSERIKMLPFNVHFTQDRRDPNLKHALQTPESLSGVLNWALEGLQLLRAEGFKEPAAVLDATEEYRRKSDKLGLFLDERTERGEGLEVPLMELHNAFGNWCSTSGLVPVGVPRFREMLEERQLVTKKKRPAGSGRSGKTAIFVLQLRLLAEN